jgi:hypothetical protein
LSDFSNPIFPGYQPIFLKNFGKHINTNNLSRYYDAAFKQRIVEYYLQNQPNQRRHTIVKRWFDRYDGTVSSLPQQYRSGRPSILNKQEINQYTTQPVRSL